MGITYSQMFPPTATLTEKNVPSQQGKVFIVTGGASGVGLELSRILYQAGGKVYIAGRSEENARNAIADIKASSSKDDGQIEFLHLVLDDLTTIKSAVETFKSKESRLDVLWNNAAVSSPPSGSKSKQGHETQMATNCLGPYLFTQLLLPLLKSTAENSAPGSVRVVWAGSLVIDMSPKDGLIKADLNADSTSWNMTRKQSRYAETKTGNWFLGSEFAADVGKSGIISITQNPGNLKTQLTRHMPWLAYLVRPLLYEPKYGAYTELWSGLSSDVTMNDNGGLVMPWGRMHPAPRADVVNALKSKEDGGSGTAKEFVQWCFDETREFR